ncbi:hypothetical protein NQ318_013991 [Aromia moschata]|uniref:Uncharacterized protein n=1 Tax=Aromia moschata TaxID=1265417 RepID=A0AAV8YYI8_9CUCU|nr:hypothetical protein NQ318_013991 [Aromia moschata]
MQPAAVVDPDRARCRTLDTALNAVVCLAGIRALGQLELGARAPSRGRITPNYTVCVKPTSACYKKRINRSETTDKKQPQTHQRRKLRAPFFPPIGDCNYKIEELRLMYSLLKQTFNNLWLEVYLRKVYI